MKNILLIAASAILISSCGNSSSTEAAKTEDTKAVATITGDTYVIDSTSSQVIWTGSGVGHGHQGVFRISQGSMGIKDGALTGGSFDISINDIKSIDLKGKEMESLMGHLLSPDFFDAAKYPKAHFEITKVAAIKSDTANAMVSGNLTLKDSTKNVTFPAKVTAATSGSTADATATFIIDRTQWGMFYNSEKSLGDKFISPSVGISIKIASAKK
jgi:polyisoprenoid-binding protein YceI